MIETRPDPFPYDTLHSLRYFLTHPIPRVFWGDKLTGLGLAMVEQGSVRQKGKGFNFGPGFPGHIFNDNPWVSLVVYSVGLAMTLRFMDRVIIRFPVNPFVIVPMGVAVGEILVLARGELGLFFVRTVASTGGAWIAMWLCARPSRGRWACDRPRSRPNPRRPAPETVIDPDLAAEYGESESESTPEPVG